MGAWVLSLDRGLGEDAETLLTPARAQAERRGELLCASCRRPLTSRSASIEAAGAHRHTFTNPYGLVFNVRCFSEAPGCAESGSYSGEWTWFAGYEWRFAHCRHCLIHAGWRYRGAGGHSFFGLIAERLVEAREGG